MAAAVLALALRLLGATLALIEVGADLGSPPVLHKDPVLLDALVFALVPLLLRLLLGRRVPGVCSFIWSASCARLASPTDGWDWKCARGAEKAKEWPG